MITHREDIDLDHFIVHRVNDAMFSIDTPRPLPGQIILQGFWLSAISASNADIRFIIALLPLFFQKAMSACACSEKTISIYLQER